MHPEEFLKLAKSLANQNDEPSIRTSVGRSYYGLYNFLVNFLVSNDFKIPADGTAHKKTYMYFNNCGVSEVEDVAGELSELLTDRNHADYELDRTEFQNQNVAQLTYLKANANFANFSDATNNRNKRRKIIQGICAYKKKTNN